MSLRRVAPVLGRILILSMAVAIVPACKKKEDKAPHIVDGLPLPDASGVSHWPLMVLEFDKALDPTSLSGNIQIYLTDAFGVPTVPWGAPPTLTYLSGSFQVVIEPPAALTASTEFAVVVFGGLTAADGTPIVGGLALRFVVGSAANAFRPVFTSPPSVAPGAAAGTVDFTWPQAQENSINISANYDIYVSLNPGGIDLLGGFALTRTDNTGFTMGLGGPSGTLSPATTYYFRIVCRDTDGNTTITGEISATTP